MKSRDANTYLGSAPTSISSQDTSYNTYEVVSLGTDYKLVEGLLTYVEVSNFKFKRDLSSVNNKGTVLLAGTKLEF
jgi:autotransporter adhesin